MYRLAVGLFVGGLIGAFDCAFWPLVVRDVWQHHGWRGQSWVAALCQAGSIAFGVAVVLGIAR